MIRFGPAGNSESFYEQGHKTTIEAAPWLEQRGLTAFEYPCGRGVNLREASARAIGEAMGRCGIRVSVHAPYYINLAADDEERQGKAIGYMLGAGHIADWMGGARIVVHPGAAGKDRAAALAIAQGTLQRARQAMDDEGLSHIHVCLETLGKRGQLGDLSEVLSLCASDERHLPAIDFGHLHARDLGAIRGIDDYDRILGAIRDALGADRLRRMHVHFSRIEYNQGGERKHRRFDEAEFGPDSDPLMALIARYDLEPVVICESDGTMAEDAMVMRDQYLAHRGALA